MLVSLLNAERLCAEGSKLAPKNASAPTPALCKKSRLFSFFVAMESSSCYFGHFDLVE